MTTIGLISDTHIPEAGDALPDEIWPVFKGVDLILHAGDLHILDVLDRLEDIAPVRAVRGNGDVGLGGRQPVPDDPRLKPTDLFSVDGLRIGMTHGIPLPEEMPGIPLDKTMNRLFGDAVDVLVFGDTHVDYVKQHGSSLLINPGSPTLPYNLVGHLGTVGILEIRNGRPKARIVPLGKWPVR